MKLKTWLRKVNKLKKERDFITIGYDDYWYPNGVKTKTFQTISLGRLKEYPLLLEADVIEENIYDSEYMDLTISMETVKEGVCKQYSAKLDKEQVKIAYKNRGKKSL